MWNRSSGRCWYCGVDLNPALFHVDHVTARNNGGTNDMSNLVAACPPCNVTKKDRTIDEFRWVRIRQRDGIPRFSDEQTRWLMDQGFTFPDVEPYLFWFEEEGLA